MNDHDLEKAGLTITCPDAYELAKFDKEEFIKVRRNSFGASDSSVLLGVNPFTKVEDLIKQKCSTEITKEELEVGEKENVRKGADLEPLILNKFEHWSGFDTYKPDAMYQLNLHPQLSVNFDGIIELENIYIPVEAKFVSVFAHKYWDRSKAIKAPHEGLPIRCAGKTIVDHITDTASLYGIPPYYFTQIQQQMLALNAPFGYLAALFDKGWELLVFKIFSDGITQHALIDISATNWKLIEARKAS